METLENVHRIYNGNINRSMVSPLVRSSSKPFGANFTILESSPWLRTIPADQIWRWASNGIGKQRRTFGKMEIHMMGSVLTKVIGQLWKAFEEPTLNVSQDIPKDPFEYSTSEWQKLGNAGSLTLAGSPSITFFFSFSFSSIHSDYLLFHDYEIIITRKYGNPLINLKITTAC